MWPLLAALLLAPGAALAGEDWRAKLAADARFMHDDIAANHPGPYDALDPGFAARNDAALALALSRAPRVQNAAGYVFALRAYAASFDDGHVAFFMDDPSWQLPSRWPGFLTGVLADGSQRVLTRAADAPVPLGAVLQDCDGVAADALAERDLAPFAGRWQLASQHIRYGGELLLDQGNPFVKPPRNCRFLVQERTVSVDLSWRPLSAGETASRLAETRRHGEPVIGVRVLADGTRWFALGHFEGDPATPVGRALVGVIAQMRHDRDAIRAAPRIVLDLRGNSGGSSDWSDQIGATIWGVAANDAYSLRQPEVIDWRVSQANIDDWRALETRLAAAPGVSAADRGMVAHVVAGMADALKAGKSLWREHGDPSPSLPGSPEAPPRGLVYVLTDFGCASACLDAVDRWRDLGAIQIGQQTSADTYDMDNRVDRLPGGIAKIAVPMKVYRNRPRGRNVPWTPTYLYDGDMRDTAALEAWVSHLPR